MITVSVLDRSAAFADDTPVREALSVLAPDTASKAFGALCGGVAYELNQPLLESCALTPITFADEEGRRIYERSLRFVLLLAVRRVMPGARVRVEHSIGFGLYAVILGKTLCEKDIAALDAAMRDIQRENLPFCRERWSRTRALQYFKEEGEIDKTRLLAYRPYDYFNVYRCGGMAEYFYGAMLPSTGYIKTFSLKLNAPGFVLQMPAPGNPDVPAPYVDRPKHLRAFAQSNYWCKVLKCTNAADLNDLIVRNELRDFIRVNEALHDKSIAEIAEGIHARGARAVFVAGPSSSGKTTFSNRLCIHLRVLGLSPVLISLDDFYRDRNTLPFDENGQQDLEALSALDLPYFETCMKRLLAGEEALMPTFDFGRQARNPALKKVRIERTQPIVIEGIHGLNPAMHHGLDQSLICKVYISELTCLNLDNHNRIRTTDARLLRRIVRDYQFRHTPPDDTLSRWQSVRAGEEKWIFPFQEQADFVFNSALHYELPILKKYAYDMLKEIEPDNPNFLLSRRLLKILHYMLPAPDDALRDIPPLSILREFIGGCTLYD